MYANGHLLYVRGTTLFAHPFDVDRRQLVGDAQPIAENLLIGPGGNAAFSVSTNSVLVYLAGGEQGVSRLVWVDRGGKPLSTVGRDNLYSDIALSHDGRRVAATIGGSDSTDISIIDLDRGIPTRFTHDDGVEFSSVWSADDRRIVFNSLRDGRLQLLIKPVGGSVGSEQTIWSGTPGPFPTSWSPDGQYVMASIGGDLVYFPIDGDKKPIPFRQTRFVEGGGIFSPDGKWVAYRSNESGRIELWIAPFPGPGKSTQVSSDGIRGGYPRWRRDGTELFFVNDRGGLSSSSIILAGAEPRVGRTVTLVESGVKPNTRFPFDVSADGERLLVNMVVTETAGPAVTLVVNWPSALARN